MKMCEECKIKPVTGKTYWAQYCSTQCRDRANYKRVKERRKNPSASIVGEK